MRRNARLTRRGLLGLAATAAVGVACGRKPAGRATGLPETPLDALRQPSTQAPSAAPVSAVRIEPLPAQGGTGPSFTNVADAGPDEAALYFAGRHSYYPGASVANFLGYSPADIIESMDTVMVDQVAQTYGDRGLQTIYGIVARNLLESLLAVYGSQPLVLALDAGHGGKPGVYYEPGSNGTEAIHTRATVAVVESLARDARYATITIRRIFNDAIGDDFGLPPPQDSKARASLVLRNARGSMLAYEADAWNRDHPDRQVAVHVVSVHYNANSGGTLVLHQGDDVPADFERRSVAFVRFYVDHARPDLNGSGVLPAQLGLVNGNGLHDDSLMYSPPIRATGSRINPLTGKAPQGPPRYAMLQASLLEEDYVEGLLHHRGLA